MKSWFIQAIRKKKTNPPKKGMVELKAWVELLIIFLMVGGFIILVMSYPQ